MYEAYFGFNENPFNLSPDPRFFFLSPYHQEALDHLGYGILEKKGFIMITGGVGTGKTTLCRSFLNGLDEKVETAMIFNSFLSELELLETITEEFGIAKKRTRKTLKYYIDALNVFLLENFSAGKYAVLLVDEAQNLSHGVLEQIRMLSNLETEREKLIQIVLIGQPELRDLLCLPSLQQLNERITVRYHLPALDRHHIGPYIDHRLSVAGGQGRIRFTPPAYRLIHDYSEGVPRRINAICDRCLLIAYTKDLFLVDRRTVKDAMKDMGPHYIMPKRRFFKFLD
jgi:general secretion pathway protein A